MNKRTPQPALSEWGGNKEKAGIKKAKRLTLGSLWGSSLPCLIMKRGHNLTLVKIVLLAALFLNPDILGL